MENYTLSDFYNMDIIIRNDGSKTPCIAISEGHPIGIIGYNAPEGFSDLEIREDAFEYYQQLKEELEIIN